MCFCVDEKKMELHLKNRAKFYFVTSTGKADDATKHQMLAYVKIVEFLQTANKVKWISTANVISLAKSKSNIFVTIEPLLSSSDLIISPGTILKCRLRKDNENSEVEERSLEIFHNLTVTSSGLSVVEKEEIRRLITHGGTFTGSFNSKETDILITNADNNKGHKFIAAVTSNKKCVRKDWVTDSVSNGIALAYEIRAEQQQQVDQKNNDNNNDENIADKHRKDAAVEIKVGVNDASQRRHCDSVMFIEDDHLVDEKKSSQGETSSTDDSTPDNACQPKIFDSTATSSAASSASQKVNQIQTVVTKTASSTLCRQLSETEASAKSQPTTVKVVSGCVQPLQSEASAKSKPTTNFPLYTGGKPKRRICLSQSISEALRQKLTEQIENLGGTVCIGLFTQDSCTHLICEVPVLSEKTTAVIASGGWLLIPAYIEDSFAAGQFLDYDLFEWGQIIANDRRKLSNQAARKVSIVAQKWRLHLHSKSVAENRPTGIFSGFRAILHTNQKDSYQALLEAGRGVVVHLKEPYAEQMDFHWITYCFVNKRIKCISQSDMAVMKKVGVHVVTLLYLQAVFQAEHLPSPHLYLSN